MRAEGEAPSLCAVSFVQCPFGCEPQASIRFFKMILCEPLGEAINSHKLSVCAAGEHLLLTLRAEG